MELNEEKLYLSLISENHFSTWIFNPKLEKKYKEHLLKLEKDKADREKNEKEEGIKKIAFYQNHKEYNFYELENDEVYNCPLQIKYIISKLEKRHLDNKIIQSILNGSKWFGGFQKRGSKGLFIFLNDKKVWVFPPDSVMEIMSIEEKTKKRTLYSGLKTISEEREKSIHKCSGCEFNVDFFKDKEKKISVCKYK